MKIDIDFFKIEPDSFELTLGIVLISEPFSNDNYFKRSVVLLTEHSEEGSVGFILNKPIEARINEFINNFPKCNAKVYIGGPVSTDTVHFLHSRKDLFPTSKKIGTDIYWGGSFTALKKAIKEKTIKDSELLLFIGYSGWDGNQLQSEIENNYWTATTISKEIIMSPNKDNIWKETLQNLGGKFKIWGNAPETPDLN